MKPRWPTCSSPTIDSVTETTPMTNTLLKSCEGLLGDSDAHNSTKQPKIVRNRRQQPLINQQLKCDLATTNQGVVGSIPASRTIKINGLRERSRSPFSFAAGRGTSWETSLLRLVSRGLSGIPTTPPVHVRLALGPRPSPAPPPALSRGTAPGQRRGVPRRACSRQHQPPEGASPAPRAQPSQRLHGRQPGQHQPWRP